MLAQQEEEFMRETMGLRAELAAAKHQLEEGRTALKSELNVLQQSASTLHEELEGKELKLREAEVPTQSPTLLL